MNNETSDSAVEDGALTILIPSSILSTFVVIILFALTLCAIKRMCVAKKTDEDHINQQPVYEEVTQCHKGIPMEENAAYGHIIMHATS